MDHQETRQYLLSIRRTTESLLGLTRPKQTTEIIPTTQHNIAIPALDLPFPSDLGAALRTLGLSEGGYFEAYRKIQELVQNLQNLHSLKFRQACHNLSSLPHFRNQHALASSIDHVRLAYQKTYASYLPLITSHILSAQSRLNHTCKTTKTAFNNEYTPLLEFYFEQNAYPSLPDRKFLARKSMMTMRQIEVWFQNHRARARKEGKVIKKLNGHCQSQLNIGALNERAPFPITDSSMKTPIDPEYESSGDETPTTPPPFTPYPFSQVAPPHAFPTTYPSNLTTDPFPNKDGKFLFPPPMWMRTPNQSKVPTAVPDMDEFISMFASKLHLRVGPRRKCDVQHSQNTKHKKPWFGSMVVVPVSAPHPALIRAFQPSGTIIPHSNLSAPSDPPCTSLSLAPNHHKPRKFAPFSKRAPSAFPTNHPFDQPTAFSAFASRTSSLSSVTSSQRSSSLSSIASTEPATPPLSPIRQQDPLFVDHDYQLLDELFGPEPHQIFNNTLYTTHDPLFPTISLKDVSHNTLYDLSSMFPPTVTQVHC